MNLRVVDMVKIEKEKAMLRYQKFKKIANIARTLEFFFAMAFFSWSISRSSAYFPAIVELCAFFLRWLCKIVVSQHFIFLLGNLIVIALFVKSDRSGDFYNKSASAGDDEDSLIRHFLPPRESVSEVSGEKDVPPTKIDEDRGIQRSDAEARRSRRTRSDEFELEVTEKVQLRRSETEPRQKIDCSEEELNGRRWMTVEDMSNEEFQRKVEAFIERQQRFLREESLSMVMRNRSST